MAIAVYKSLVSGTEAAVVDMSSRNAAPAPAAQSAAQPASDVFIKGNSGSGLAGLIGGHGRRVAPQAQVQAPALFRKA